MTEEEFRVETRRIAIAFDLPNASPIDIDRWQNKSHLNEIEFNVEFGVQDFKVTVWLSKPENHWGFTIGVVGTNFFTSGGWPDNPEFDWRGEYLQYIPFLVRAMYRLGFDISLLETEFNLNITAHEKLEWQLEFQRRLREETSQTE